MLSGQPRRRHALENEPDVRSGKTSLARELPCEGEEALGLRRDGSRVVEKQERARTGESPEIGDRGKLVKKLGGILPEHDVDRLSVGDGALALRPDVVGTNHRPLPAEPGDLSTVEICEPKFLAVRGIRENRDTRTLGARPALGGTRHASTRARRKAERAPWLGLERPDSRAAPAQTSRCPAGLSQLYSSTARPPAARSNTSNRPQNNGWVSGPAAKNSFASGNSGRNSLNGAAGLRRSPLSRRKRRSSRVASATSAFASAGPSLSGLLAQTARSPGQLGSAQRTSRRSVRLSADATPPVIPRRRWWLPVVVVAVSPRRPEVRPIAPALPAAVRIVSDPVARLNSRRRTGRRRGHLSAHGSDAVGCQRRAGEGCGGDRERARPGGPALPPGHGWRKEAVAHAARASKRVTISTATAGRTSSSQAPRSGATPPSVKTQTDRRPARRRCSSGGKPSGPRL